MKTPMKTNWKDDWAFEKGYWYQQNEEKKREREEEGSLLADNDHDDNDMDVNDNHDAAGTFKSFGYSWYLLWCRESKQ